MSNYAGKQTRIASDSGAAPIQQQAAGKVTRVEQSAPPSAPALDVQQRVGGSAGSREENIQASATRGLATPSSSLPHADLIQQSFGRHDVSSVKAHTGSAAADSAKSMGADGFASNDHVVLASSDLFTEAHEAAHTVQQRGGGVQLKGGVGQQGDVYEQNADAVASAVVQGKSAEALLDPFAGAGASSGGGGATQLKLSIGGKDAKEGKPEEDVEAVWGRISGDARLAEILEPARALLTEWITKDAKYADPSQVSQNRHYQSDEQLIRALVGDVKAAGNLEREGGLAAQTLSEGEVNATLGGFLAKLQAFQQKKQEALKSAAEKQGRYAGWAYPATKLDATLASPPGDLHGRIAFIADYALMMRREIGKETGWDFKMSAELSEGRHTHHNTNEDSTWVQEAREADAPVSAGPSATTAQVLALAVSVNADDKEKEALAWALFTLWNMMPLHQSGTHRFHEVMAVAMQYGVPYEKFQYANPPKHA